jgi:hypothetical protein
MAISDINALLASFSSFLDSDQGHFFCRRTKVLDKQNSSDRELFHLRVNNITSQQGKIQTNMYFTSGVQT